MSEQKASNEFSPKAEANYLVYEGLRLINVGLQGLQISTKTVIEQARLLDVTSEHGVELDDELWRKATQYPYVAVMHPLSRAIRELNHALEGLERAGSPLEGLFRGELKKRAETAFSNYVDDGKQLRDSLVQILNEQRAAKRPFEIRQQSLGILMLSFGEITQPLTVLIENVSGKALCDDMFKALSSLADELSQLHDAYSSLRDNPAQLMGDQLQDLHDRAGKAFASATEIRQDAYEECKREGMKFYNRAGLVV